MPKLKLPDRGREEEIEPGTDLFTALKDMGVNVKSYCNGRGICGKCKVVVASGGKNLTEVTNPERDFLTEEQIKSGYRLACRAKLRKGSIEVRVPNTARQGGELVLEDGQELEFQVDPIVRTLPLGLQSPSLKNSEADFERLARGLKAGYGMNIEEIDYQAQKKLPRVVRERKDQGEGYEISATIFNEEEIIGVAPGLRDKSFGLAVDVGTTTLVSYLVDFDNGETISTSSSLNPQVEIGGDVITRITEANRGKMGKGEMRDLVVEGVNELIDENLAEAGVERDRIYLAVFVGNTAMHHFALGIDAEYVARPPFVPGRQGLIQVKARDAGINIMEGGYVIWLPVNGGWVGADNISTLLAAELHKRDEVTLVIDIGTNGEVALGNKDKALVTSTAAGPALEGYNIKHGMRAKPGAIEKISIDEETLEPKYQTIKDNPPEGLCGSGIIDATAEMLRAGIINSGGKFDSESENNRIRKGENGEYEYVLVWAEDNNIGQDIVVTQGDIREVQKAKGAIQAAARVLMDQIGVEEIDRILLAGAFGNYINTESALTIGLFPDCKLDKVSSIGNSAGQGAKLVLLDRNKLEEAEKIPDLVKFFEIAGTDEFRGKFMEAINLPHKDLDLYPSVRDLSSKEALT